MLGELSIFQKIKIHGPKTVLRSLVKVGLFKLLSIKEKATDRAFLIDNSIQLGSQKCLVVLGVRLSTLKGKPLTLEDMEVISVEVHESSNAEAVCKALERAKEKILKDSDQWEKLPIYRQAAEYAGQLLDFVGEDSAQVLEGKVWLRSSEIIESLFGKVKHLAQDQCKGGFTSLILGATGCIGKIDSQIIAQALQVIKTKDVNAWVKEWIGTRVTSKRSQAFGGWRKKRKKNIEQEAVGIINEGAVSF